jgi:transketolase C-terminal domain/subunit
MRRIGVPNRFGEVGQPDELKKVMHMTYLVIAEAAMTVIPGKNN